MRWIVRYQKWRAGRRFQLMPDEEAKFQKSQRFPSQRRNPFNLCSLIRKSHPKNNVLKYMLLRSDTTESWDDSMESGETLSSEISAVPATPMTVHYGSEDRFLLEHLIFLVLQTQPRAVATLYNDNDR